MKSADVQGIVEESLPTHIYHQIISQILVVAVGLGLHMMMIHYYTLKPKASPYKPHNSNNSNSTSYYSPTHSRTKFSSMHKG